ncbi:MAG: helix-turn-helix transcriptional regulator [Desulfitobacteriaceae bacterium]|nr:helix-turn-helix transcriptional regulator [Desulfitobacteriaceae bacterium]MDI6915937.1 helix-turn-helix transcriptional regulator [Desulfitobacteriaceae bacterium]
MEQKTGVPWKEVRAELLKDPETAQAVKEMEPEYEIIKEIIEARIKQGLTQEELANRIGTRQSNISRLEVGEANPSLRFLKKLAAGLGKELHISFR